MVVGCLLAAGMVADMEIFGIVGILEVLMLSLMKSISAPFRKIFAYVIHVIIDGA